MSENKEADRTALFRFHRQALAGNVARISAEKGLSSRKELALLCDVSPNHLARVLSRKGGNPTLDYLIRLAVALEVPLIDLLVVPDLAGDAIDRLTKGIGQGLLHKSDNLPDGFLQVAPNLILTNYHAHQLKKWAEIDRERLKSALGKDQEE